MMTKAKLRKIEARRAAYFQVGKVVESYTGGHDLVIAYTSDVESPWVGWYVEVRACYEDGTPLEHESARIHFTEPTERMYKAAGL